MLALVSGIVFLACIGTLILVGSTIPQPIPPTPIAQASAVSSASDALPATERTRARALYDLHCVGCHGAQGEGMVLIHPALTTPRVQQELPVAELRRIIVEGAGIADIMPPYEAVLSADEIDLMVRWLRAGM
jgi:mono/diheme cytochrome c family protein